MRQLAKRRLCVVQQGGFQRLDRDKDDGAIQMRRSDLRLGRGKINAQALTRQLALAWGRRMMIVVPECMMQAALRHARQPRRAAFFAARCRRPAASDGRVDHQGNRHQARKNCLHSFATLPARIITLIGGIVKRTSGKDCIIVKLSQRRSRGRNQRVVGHHLMPQWVGNQPY